MTVVPPIIVTQPTAGPAGDTEPITSVDQHHSHRRFFIGPLPEKFVSKNEVKVHKKKKLRFLRVTDSEPRSEDDDDDDDDENLPELIKEHAFSFFIREGGNVEEWDDNAEQSVRKEMLRKWRDSEWGRILWRRREKEPQARQAGSRWVGGSFEIGSYLGVNVLAEEPAESLMERLSTRNSESASTRTRNGVKSAGAGETFVTANSRLSPSPAPTPPLDGQFPSDENIADTSSSTGLLRPSPIHSPNSKPRTDSIPRKISKTSPSTGVKSDGHVGFVDPPHPSQLSPTRSSRNKGKRKATRYSEGDAAVREGPPLPPGEVLERTGSAVEETSAGATEDAVPQKKDEAQWGDVVMRDRMLVRVSHTKSESLGTSFDEALHRTTRNLHYEEWAEFMVVWRQDRLEIYEDYSLPGKEWFTGHKNLAFLIQLKAPATRVSLYSFVDLTFCLMSVPTPVHPGESKTRSIFHREKEGTNIFVFKPKSRTRALDWMWQLWRQLGGETPPSIEVRCPELDARVRIDVPAIAGSEQDYIIFTRTNVIELCKSALQSLSDWDDVIERRMRKGRTLELAWRMETKLDWVWQEEDVNGQRRDSQVLCGLTLKQSGRPSRLEIHLKEHFPSIVHLSDDINVHEPPAIEGYLERIKPNTQTKQTVYLASHDGNLFSLSPAHAHPPAPPGLEPSPTLSAAADYTSALRAFEVRRGARQIVDAHGVSDLRSILAVRRAFQPVARSTHSEEEDSGGIPDPQRQNGNSGFEAYARVERAESDNEDEGGDEGLAKYSDKARLRMKRSFELLLTSGHVIRFEAYSRRVAVEWVERLRALIFYWKHRHHVDAREEMDLAQVGSKRPPLTPHVHKYCEGRDLPPDPPADPEAFLPALGSLYNWCVLDGCKPVLKGGKIFTRKGLRGQYKLVQLFLVSGHLVQYHITPKSALHHRRTKIINLLDAYVCSGYFAALTLPKGQYNPTSPTVARRYQDGLETDDPEDDMLFIIWFRPHLPLINERKDKGGMIPAASIPPLSAKRKLVVFRTRSKLERDAWCWALNCEIDRMVRERKEREEKLRETGGLVKL